MSRERVIESKSDQYRNEELIETTKALMDLYKSAFGESWREAFQDTIQIVL